MRRRGHGSSGCGVPYRHPGSDGGIQGCEQRVHCYHHRWRKAEEGRYVESIHKDTGGRHFKNKKKSETREALLQRNVRILSSIAKSILPVKDDTLVLLVANPVDILTQLFQEISGIPRERVFGSGTFLDTMRLRTELSMRYNIAATHIHTYIVGMHGDLQVRLGPFDACDPFCDYNDPQRALDAHQQTRNTHTHTLRHALTFASTNWIHTCNHYKTDSAVGCWQCR
uniref:Lactate/malate dehydrogenase N-terminal domain-containing protein n=1 Tax=Lotharella globosa TaxID=91324 RepID=A0A7S3YCC8_9EUKA